jgi:molybdenum cofactor guanylyltransferase
MVIAAVILAGGQSRRYQGLAKGMIPCQDGRPIMARLIVELETAGISAIVISANDPLPYEPFGKKVIPDLRPRQGPLGGIESALSDFSTQLRPEEVVVLPCDLPGISFHEIVHLRDVFCQSGARIVVAETDRQWHPLCAVVRLNILEEVRRALDEERREVKQLWQDLGAIGVAFSDHRPFFNINSPEDLQQWREGEP